MTRLKKRDFRNVIIMDNKLDKITSIINYQK